MKALGWSVGGATRRGRRRAPAAGYGSVLLVERDERAKQVLEQALLKQGLQTLWARSTAEAENIMSARQPCLIILNPRLSPDDGWLAYRRLRRFQVPIVVVTAPADAVMERTALVLGADDCVMATDGMEDIAIRARLVLGRAARGLPPVARCGSLRLDVAEGRASIGGRVVHLTRSECALLAALIEAQGRVVSRDHLVNRARAAAGALPLARSIDAHVRSLRRKLGDNARHPGMLVSVRGFGYRLAPPEEPDRSRWAEPEQSLARLGSVALAGVAFDAVDDPLLVIDAQRRVKLMNRAATKLAWVDGGVAAEQPDCGKLLGCHPEPSGGTACPGLVALESGLPQCTEHLIAPRGVPRRVRETIAPLPEQPEHFLLHLHEAAQ